MSKTMQFKAEIKNMALKNHMPAQSVLQNFMLERLLERISISKAYWQENADEFAQANAANVV